MGRVSGGAEGGRPSRRGGNGAHDQGIQEPQTKPSSGTNKSGPMVFPKVGGPQEKDAQNQLNCEQSAHVPKIQGHDQKLRSKQET